MRDHLLFFRQFRSRFKTTGAIAPSSRFLASAMTRPLRQRARPARILEVGPGTGAVTKKIVQLMGPEDSLDLVELNETFADLLRARFAKDGEYGKVSAQARLHVCPIQDFHPESNGTGSGQFDYIISGLPLNNFPADLVQDIFQTFFKLLAPGGVLSYFEYMYVRPIRKVISRGEDRQRLCDLDAVISPYLKTQRLRRDWVFVNFPPAWVQHLTHVGECKK